MSLFSADKNYFSTWWTAIDFWLVSISTIHGEKQVKNNEQQLTYFITPSNPNSTFEWQLPKGCKILQNKGSSVTINWGTKPGNINVTEVIDNKCEQKYPTIYVRLSN